MSTNIIQFSTNTIFLRILEHMSYIKLYTQYTSYIYSYPNIIINKLIFNNSCSILSKYKDFLIFYSGKEFIHRFYSKNELYNRLKKICVFYEKNSRIFPNYIILYENKYIYKNIRKKQKMIYAVNKLKNKKNMKNECECELNDQYLDNCLFTDEVEYEIAKDNIINQSNYLTKNENIGDSLFTINSTSFYFKNDNNNTYNISKESFISNNESNISIYNIMEILNENKIYVNDLRTIFKKENINKNHYITIGDRLKKYEGIRQILLKGNLSGKNINNNNINNLKLKNNDKIQTKKNIIEENANLISNSIKIINKFRCKQFQNLSTISTKIKKSNKKIKMKEYENNKTQNNIKDKDKNNKILNNQKNSNYPKLISPKNNNKYIKNAKEKLLLNNIDNFRQLQILGKIKNKNNLYLLTKANQNGKQTHQNKQKKNTINKNVQQKQDKLIKNNLNPNQLNNIKKLIRYKHFSQDISSLFNKNKSKNNSLNKKQLKYCNSLTNNFKNIIKKENVNSKVVLTTNSIIKTNKDLSNIKTLKKSSTIKNNKTIIHNKKNNYLTDENNPNLITRANKNKYDFDDNDMEREKLFTFLKDVLESRTERYHRKINSEEKSSEKSNFTNIITDINSSNKKNINSNQKIKIINKGKYYNHLISKQRKGKIFKKNYKYYFNHINNNSYNYPKIKYNIIRNDKGDNSTEKYNKSISSISKLKKNNSIFSLKTEDFISPNKDLCKNDTLKRINCYSHKENKNKYRIIYIKKRNKKKTLSKSKKSPKLKNMKLHVLDFIYPDSSINIFNQHLERKKSKDLLLSLSKEELKINKYQKNKKLNMDNDNKNMTLTSFKSVRNKGKSKNKINIKQSYKNKRKNIDFQYKNKLIINSRFASCDFDAMKKENNKFSKGFVNRINNNKNK